MLCFIPTNQQVRFFPKTNMQLYMHCGVILCFYQAVSSWIASFFRFDSGATDLVARFKNIVEQQISLRGDPDKTAATIQMSLENVEVQCRQNPWKPQYASHNQFRPNARPSTAPGMTILNPLDGRNSSTRPPKTAPESIAKSEAVVKLQAERDGLRRKYHEQVCTVTYQILPPRILSARIRIVPASGRIFPARRRILPASCIFPDCGSIFPACGRIFPALSRESCPAKAKQQHTVLFPPDPPLCLLIPVFSTLRTPPGRR
jgi:hypothetical protein